MPAAQLVGSDGEPHSPEGLGYTMGQGAVLLPPLPSSTGEVEAQRRRGACPRPLQTLVSGARLRFQIQWSPGLPWQHVTLKGGRKTRSHSPALL